VAFVPPASNGAVLLEVTPGDYIVACHLPVGMMHVDDEVDGPPHFSKGMFGEFSVA